MGSSHPDDVDESTVPADPGRPDETLEPAEWDDAWLPGWLGYGTDGAPSVEGAALEPDPEPAPDAAVSNDPPEPDTVPTPDPVPEPDVVPEPDAGDQPDAGAPAAPEPDPEPPVVLVDDLLTADPDETSPGPAPADAEPAELAEPGASSQPAPVRVV